MLWGETANYIANARAQNGVVGASEVDARKSAMFVSAFGRSISGDQCKLCVVGGEVGVLGC